jgi:hypothetical protein
MDYSMTICVIALISITVPSTFAEPLNKESNVVTIPLNRIRIAIPGSRQLRELEPEFFVYRDTPEKAAKYSTPEGLSELKRIQKLAAEKSLVYGIERSLQRMASNINAKPPFAFLVVGRDRNALPGIHDILVKGEKHRVSAPSTSDITIVFCSASPQSAARLVRVDRKGNTLEIHYVPHAPDKRYIGWRLALIPLGKLPPGTYRAKLVPSAEKTTNRTVTTPNQSDTGKEPITTSFHFEIKDSRRDKE